MIHELRYYTDNKCEVMLGDIIEFPDNKMNYNGTDIVSIDSIELSKTPLEGYIFNLSDGKSVAYSGPNFWRAKLLARNLLSE